MFVRQQQGEDKVAVQITKELPDSLGLRSVLGLKFRVLGFGGF